MFEVYNKLIGYEPSWSRAFFDLTGKTTQNLGSIWQPEKRKLWQAGWWHLVNYVVKNHPTEPWCCQFWLSINWNNAMTSPLNSRCHLLSIVVGTNSFHKIPSLQLNKIKIKWGRCMLKPKQTLQELS